MVSEDPPSGWGETITTKGFPERGQTALNLPLLTSPTADHTLGLGRESRAAGCSLRRWSGLIVTRLPRPFQGCGKRSIPPRRRSLPDPNMAGLVQIHHRCWWQLLAARGGGRSATPLWRLPMTPVITGHGPGKTSQVSHAPALVFPAPDTTASGRRGCILGLGPLLGLPGPSLHV